MIFFLFFYTNYIRLELINSKNDKFFCGESLLICNSRDPETLRLHVDTVHGKKSVKDELNELNESDKQVLFWWQCLQDLYNFRRKLKKRIQEVPFLDIEDEFSCLDKVYMSLYIY